MAANLSADITLEGVPATARLDAKEGRLSWEAQGGAHPSSSSSSSLSASGSLALSESLLGWSHGASTIMLRTLSRPASPRGCLPGPASPQRKDLLLDFQDTHQHAAWLDALNAWHAAARRPRRLLVIMNLMAGRGKAREVYEKEVLPLLQAAGIAVTVLVTKYHRHAIQMGKEVELEAYDGVACLSGDGIVTEVINGLLQREDWQSAIQMPLGHIPAGSGNGLAKSALFVGGEKECSAQLATVAIIKGRTSSLDVFSVTQGSSSFHGALNFCWGFVSDVDIESEVYRWMGGFRLTFQSLVRMISLRKYKGTLQYLKAEETGARDSSDGGGGRSGAEAGPFKAPSASSVEGGREWRSLDGEFVLAWAQNTPWAASDMHCAPLAKLDNGCLDLMLVSHCSSFQLLSLFLALSDGSHHNSTLCQYIKVEAIRFEPGPRVHSKVPGGIVSVDGEVLARGVGAAGNRNDDIMDYEQPFEVVVSPGLARMFIG